MTGGTPGSQQPEGEDGSKGLASIETERAERNRNLSIAGRERHRTSRAN